MSSLKKRVHTLRRGPPLQQKFRPLVWKH